MSDHMTQAEALRFTRTLLNVHGLTNWSVVFDNAVRRAGRCDYTTQTIHISKKVMESCTVEGTRDTIYHEVAHALTRGDRHGPKWRTLFIKLGGNGKAIFDEDHMLKEIKGKYLLSCPSCPHQSYMHRIPAVERSCHKCNPRRYDERFKMVITDTATGLRVAPKPRETRRRKQLTLTSW